MSVDLFQSIDLYEQEDYIYMLQHLDSYPPQVECVEINKSTKEIRLIKKNSQLFKLEEKRIIFGVLGFLKLLKSFVAVVVTKRRLVGKILTSEIFSIEQIDIISCDNRKHETIATNDGEYLNLIHQHFSAPGFYFSYSYDLTRSLDRNLDCQRKATYSSLVEYNSKYLWNRHLLKRIIHVKEIYRYFLPIIWGYIGRHVDHMLDFNIHLISRRSNERVGTRYFVRGGDKEGNVVNYVETETIFICGLDAFSFIQVRGSIPLAWSQYPNLKYKPRILINPKANQIDLVKSHFARELEERRREIVINLTDDKGDEGCLSGCFSNALEKINFDSHKLCYFYFDFHKNCAKMRFDRVSLLLDKIEELRIQMGFFQFSLDNTNQKQNGQVVNRQFGAFRTNCIDCLDRTNVVQSAISWKTLMAMTQECRLLNDQNGKNVHQKMELVHKHLWADNADYLSIQYSGTPALKTDFTRHGVRTFRGLFEDGLNSAKRYLKSNFSDGTRQDALDLIVGNFDFDTQRPDVRPNSLKSPSSAILPIIFVCLFILLIGDIFLLSNSNKSRIVFGILQLWGMVSIVKYVTNNPEKYIDFPRLVVLESRDKFK
ncbi:Phosphatidylinositide phosphatase SAC1 [Thelohanellus kitauei]|uniref:Phosphatidylinositol-3-phosphatase SAC1 n=1 Tax=Thelohanellus kitauei TaxID=669202 RepID=A0A0C2MML1_THEKT|nr:Phosphatidylinositide phosphatase SAC1 [Thelohanellus kitauei]